MASFSEGKAELRKKELSEGRVWRLEEIYTNLHKSKDVMILEGLGELLVKLLKILRRSIIYILPTHCERRLWVNVIVEMVKCTAKIFVMTILDLNCISFKNMGSCGQYMNKYGKISIADISAVRLKLG